MLRKIFLPSIFLFLTYGFWISPNFKEICAGVAIFLFGMLSLEEGFRAFSGGGLEKLLRRTTDRQWKSISLGILSTTIMQSSSLVSVITISFLSAGLLGLTAGIGIIFGANLGTTTGAWLVAGFGLKVKISAYAMPMLVFGIIFIFQKNKALKGVGYILAGLGFLFLGIHHMKEGFEAFKDNIDLTQYAVTGYPGLFLFAAIGIAATVIMQSSHATLVLIITALAAQQITYENALALSIGANVGTTITAILGAMSAEVQGKRLAGAHLIFNAVTGIIAIIFISQFMITVNWISANVGIRVDDYTLKLAVFHTLFNLTGVTVMIPFISRLANLLEKTLPAKETAKIGPKYLHMASVDFPETAVVAIRKETLYIYDNAVEIIAHGICLTKEDIFSEKDLDQVAGDSKIIEVDIEDVYEKNIKGIYSFIIAFISKATFSWEVEQSASIHWLRNANRHIVEAVKDVKHLRKNLVKFLQSDNKFIQGQYNNLRVQIATTLRELGKIRASTDEDSVVLSLDALKLSLKEDDDEMNRQVVNLIKSNKITPEMGTSLINDSSYTQNISKNLIEMGSTLLVNYDEMEISVEREISLDDDELAEVSSASV